MTVSKHAALAAELERNILSGKYGWEGGLPTTGELAQQWNMSINTVKIALTVLETKNLIERRGSGYYVNRISAIMTQYVPPAATRLKQPGYCKNIGLAKRTALPDHIVEKLNLTQTDAVYRVQVSGELSEGKEKPLQITYRYYVLPISDEQLQRMQNDANYDPMWTDPNLTELLSHDEVTPRIATTGEADLLELPENTPVTNLFESIHDKNNGVLTAQEIILSPRTTLIFDFPFTNQPSQ